MKKTQVNFDYSLFLSGKYEIASRGGAPVVIAGAIVDERGETAILGKCNKIICQWSDEGRFYGTTNNPQMDLVMYIKPKTIYVNVVLSKNGIITSRTTEHKNVYARAGNKTLAQYELEVEDDYIVAQ
jgi:hypothetical protein